MNKNTASVTATTYTVDPALVSLDAADRDALVKPYRWDTEEAARMAVRMFRGLAGMYKVTRHTAPGLEVFAIYREGRRSEGEPELVLMSVIEFSDDTAARLHKAVRREQPVTITYTRADGTGTVRTIEPFALKTNVTGAVRVASLDRESGEVRDFRIDRISTYTVHRTRRTVRTAAPAPTKAELWEAWKASQRESVPARSVTRATGYDETRTSLWDALDPASPEPRRVTVISHARPTAPEVHAAGCPDVERSPRTNGSLTFVADTVADVAERVYGNAAYGEYLDIRSCTHLTAAPDGARTPATV